MDFTSDSKIIGEIIGNDSAFFLSDLTETSRAMSLIGYAEHTKNEKMIKAVEKEFAPEFVAFFNE